jgi:hypothetical protein
MTGRGPAELPHSFQTGITKSINSSTTIEARIAVQSQATELTDAGEGACELRMMLRTKRNLHGSPLLVSHSQKGTLCGVGHAASRFTLMHIMSVSKDYTPSALLEGAPGEKKVEEGRMS